MENLKQNVINRMIELGNNPKEVELMVNENFDFAQSKYKNNIKKIANYIRVVG